MKKVLIALILGIVLVGMLATPGFAKKTPPPTPGPHGTIKGLCMFYYGTWSNDVFNKIKEAKPEFVVLNTAAGPYGTENTYLTDKVVELQSYPYLIKVLSYVPVGMMCGYVYPEPDAPLQNDGHNKSLVLGWVDAIAAEGCDGIFFDEASVGYWRTATGEVNSATEPAPAKIVQRDEKGNWYYSDQNTVNDWALPDANGNYVNTLGKLCAYAQAAGLDYTVAGVDSTNLNANMFDAFNYVLSDEDYTNRLPQGGEIGHAAQCWVISGGVKSASKAALYTETALNNFGGAYHCQSYGTLASWFNDYINLLAQYQGN
jgi:hypothetical protein